MTDNKVTIYTKGGMGNIVKIEARLIDHGTKPWAQYAAAAFVNYVRKGARTERQMVQAYRPYFLICAGWGLHDPDGAFGCEQQDANGTTFRRSRYAAFDDRWQQDFDARINAAIERGDVQVVADYRHTSQQDAA
jgi:hypothetical protein